MKGLLKLLFLFAVLVGLVALLLGCVTPPQRQPARSQTAPQQRSALPQQPSERPRTDGQLPTTNITCYSLARFEAPFHVGSAALTDAQRNLLKDLALQLRAEGHEAGEVGGYADASEGPDQEALGLARARAVAEYLTAQNFTVTRVASGGTNRRCGETTTNRTATIFVPTVKQAGRQLVGRNCLVVNKNEDVDLDIRVFPGHWSVTDLVELPFEDTYVVRRPFVKRFSVGQSLDIGTLRMGIAWETQGLYLQPLKPYTLLVRFYSRSPWGERTIGWEARHTSVNPQNFRVFVPYPDAPPQYWKKLPCLEEFSGRDTGALTFNDLVPIRVRSDLRKIKCLLGLC